MRRATLVVVCFLMLVGGCRCNWARYDFNWHTFRFERVGPRARPERAATPRDEVASEPTQSARPAAGQGHDRVGPAGLDQVAAEKERRYRLYLARSDDAKSLPAENVCVVRDAPVDKLSELLALFYPGDGPGGGRRRFIIYKNAEVWKEARDFVGLLDLGDVTPDSEAELTWRKAIAEVYASDYPRKLTPNKRFVIVNLLNRVSGDAQADRRLRWAAGVLTGYLYTRYDPKDYQLATVTMIEVAKLVRGRSYRSMVVEYHQIRQLAARGLNRSAIKQAREALDTYLDWKDTSCYQLIQLEVAGD